MSFTMKKVYPSRFCCSAAEEFHKNPKVKIIIENSVVKNKDFSQKLFSTPNKFSFKILFFDVVSTTLRGNNCVQTIAGHLSIKNKIYATLGKNVLKQSSSKYQTYKSEFFNLVRGYCDDSC